MSQFPRMFVTFHWADRGAGRMRYTVRKAWVPRPGQPSSSRSVHAGEVVVQVAETDERAAIAAVLLVIAEDLVYALRDGAAGPGADELVNTGPDDVGDQVVVD